MINRIDWLANIIIWIGRIGLVLLGMFFALVIFLWLIGDIRIVNP